MKKTDIQFKFQNQRMKSINFKVNEKFTLKQEYEAVPSFLFSYSSNRKKKILVVELGIRFSSTKAPCSLEVISEGVFIFKEMPKVSALEEISCTKCNPMIFPFLRETIADLTRRAGIPPLLLPPVNFVDFYKSFKKEQSKAT